VVTVLAKFVLDFDPHFTFTTITINYNYASAPHRDVNHEDGRARIIALGDFEGGELNIEGRGDVDIRNNWYDFDGRILHSTKPFLGERYSLVYFTHLSWKLNEGEEVGRRLIALGVSWPVTLLPQIKDEVHTLLHKNNLHAQYSHFFLPLKKRHQYEAAFESEISSLCSLYLKPGQYDIYPIPERNSEMISQHNLASALSVIGELEFPRSIADRAVSFTVWKKICSSPSLELLFQSQEDVGWITPQKFSIEIYSPGKQLSTRQKRKVLLLAQLSRPSEDKLLGGGNLGRHPQLSLLLVYDWEYKDEDGSQGILSHVYLCEQILRCTNLEFGQKSVDVPPSQNSHLKASDQGNECSRNSTALRPVLCQLLCNVAKISHGSLVYDPFNGSGSILQIAQELGGYCLGSDASRSNLNLSFTHDHLANLQKNVFISNIYHQQVDGRGQFDAIVCDPPYGRREKHVDEKGVDSATHQTNEERALSQFKILRPLLEMSSSLLKIGGRLVFLFLK
jgi:hypothetical protein